MVGHGPPHPTIFFDALLREKGRSNVDFHDHTFRAIDNSPHPVVYKDRRAKPNLIEKELIIG
jgi:hypothetical protein